MKAGSLIRLTRFGTAGNHFSEYLGLQEYADRGTKRLVSVNICSVEGNSAGIFVSKVTPGIFVIKVKGIPIIFSEG